MPDRTNTGNPLGDDDGAMRVCSFEAHLHAAVLEEEPRLIVNDVLANVEERKFGRLQNVSTNGTEWQSPDIGGIDVGHAAGRSSADGRWGHDH